MRIHDQQPYGLPQWVKYGPCTTWITKPTKQTREQYTPVQPVQLYSTIPLRGRGRTTDQTDTPTRRRGQTRAGKSSLLPNGSGGVKIQTRTRLDRILLEGGVPPSEGPTLDEKMDEKCRKWLFIKAQRRIAGPMEGSGGVPARPPRRGQLPPRGSGAPRVQVVGGPNFCPLKGSTVVV